MLASTVAALRGRPDWFEGVDVSRKAVRQAFVVMLLTLPAYAVVALAVERARSELGDVQPREISWGVFAGLTLIYSLAFPFVAFVISTATGRGERYAGWVVVRHYAVFCVAWALAGLWLLSWLGLPYGVPNAATLLAMFLVLVIDIRLAQVVGGYPLGAATLIGSVVTTLGLTLLLAGLTLYVAG